MSNAKDNLIFVTKKLVQHSNEKSTLIAIPGGEGEKFWITNKMVHTYGENKEKFYIYMPDDFNVKLTKSIKDEETGEFKEVSRKEITGKEIKEIFKKYEADRKVENGSSAEPEQDMAAPQAATP